MKVFYTSDLHFYHRNIVQYTNRGVDTTQEEHDEWLIDLWNSQVSKGDVIWHLGDFAFNKRKVEDFLKLTDRLNGNKKFIRGNHDDKDVLKKSGFEWYDLKGGMIKISEKIKQHIVMCHYPMAVWDKQHHGSHMLHGHCLDADSEILTERGWVGIDNVMTGEAIKTFNPHTQKLEGDLVKQVFRYNYSGDMYNYKGKSVVGRVTSKHRVVGKTRNGNWFDGTVDNLPKTPLTLVHSAVGDNRGLNMTDDELKLYVYCTADGSLKEEKNLWRIRVKKEHKKIEIERVLSAIGLDYNVYTKDDYTSFNFHWVNPMLLNTKGLDVKLTDMTDHQFAVFMKAYSLSDGSVNGNGVILTTAKKCEMDLIQHLAVTHGWSCTSLTREGHGFGKLSYQLSLYPRTEAICNGLSDMVVEKVDNERVWCINTNNGNFFVRKNGKVHLTGNSHGSYQPEKGKILDVGLDNAYNVLGEHRFFTDEDIMNYMATREIEINDHHNDRTKQ